MAPARFFSCTRKIITADIPDPDNFLAILQFLRDFPRSKGHDVSIVLSPRPVSFAAPLYSTPRLLKDRIAEVKGETRNYVDQWRKAFGDYQEKHKLEKKPMHALITPLATNDVPAIASACLSPQETGWFYQDRDAKNDEEVVEDSHLYMQVSVLRMARFLEAHGISHTEYKVYWDEESLKHIKLGMRHAFHCHDWAMDFNDTELTHYASYISKPGVDGKPNQDLRRNMRDVCQRYITRVEERIGVHTQDPMIKDDKHAILHPFSDLIQDHVKKSMPVGIFVAGPFTEARKYMDDVRPVKLDLFAMAGFINGKNNIFPNQFNFHVDVESAKAVLQIVEAKRQYRMIMVPTECAKASPWEFSQTDYETTILNASKAAHDLIAGYVPFETAPYAAFDWIAGILITKDDLLPKYPVQLKIERDQATDSEILKFQRVEEHISRNLWMYWSDEDVIQKQRENRDAIFKIMCKTLKTNERL